MKRSASKIFGLALLLLLSGCGGKGGAMPPANDVVPAEIPEPPPVEHSIPAPEVPADEDVDSQPPRMEDPELAEDISPALDRLEEADWQIVSIDLESFGLSTDYDDERFMYIFDHTDTVPLDQLIVFDLWGDALTEGSSEELRSRFLEAPDTVLAYLVLMGDQRVDYWDQPLASEVICNSIASADAAWHGGTEEFAQTLASCRERYPSGRIAELLDVMEREHAASMERNQ